MNSEKTAERTPGTAENQARRVALVTGASRGIGLAIASELAREGFAVALNDVRDSDALREAEQVVRATGVPTCVSIFDVSDTAAHAVQLIRIEESLGPLTTLVNNAGVPVLSRGDLLDVTEESYDRCQAVNARAVFFLCQAFARQLLKRERGVDVFHSIVNVTSSNARAVAVQRAEYCASKAAAAMVTQAFAVRLGGEGIAVYDVQPGLIETGMTAPVIESYARRAADGLTLIPRVGRAEEVAQIVATLAAGRLPYTTGHVISADAGMLVPRF